MLDSVDKAPLDHQLKQENITNNYMCEYVCVYVCMCDCVYVRICVCVELLRRPSTLAPPPIASLQVEPFRWMSASHWTDGCNRKRPIPRRRLSIITSSSSIGWGGGPIMVGWWGKCNFGHPRIAINAIVGRRQSRHWFAKWCFTTVRRSVDCQRWLVGEFGISPDTIKTIRRSSWRSGIAQDPAATRY